MSHKGTCLNFTDEETENKRLDQMPHWTLEAVDASHSRDAGQKEPTPKAILND